MERVAELQSRGADITCAGKQSQIAQWALDNGACLLFGFTQWEKHTGVIGYKYNKNVSMLRGPGDVPKGTFSSALPLSG